MDRTEDKSSVVADTIHGQILISSFEKDVIATTLFNRMHGIHQNSTAYMTFPTNRTKRLEHSFGTMYLCGNIFSSAVCNARQMVISNFFKATEKEIMRVINSIKVNGEYNSKLGQVVKKIDKCYSEMQLCGGIYDKLLPSNVPENSRKYFIIVFESVRIAALLHDVGHPPFSHITENALNNVYMRVNEEKIDNERVKEFKRIVDPFMGEKAGSDEKKELHEEMGISIASALLKEAVKDIDEQQAKDPIKYSKQIFRLIVTEMVLSILAEKNTFYEDLHNIISGTLDGDRLDYVSRDPINSGFSTGVIEYDRLISSMQMAERDSHFLFCPNTSVINTIEDFLMRRWNMYRNIIYHHRVVKTDYLLQKSIEELAINYLKQNTIEEETENYILPYNISGLWKALGTQTSVLEQGYSISQWDDAWLTTILKKEYFGSIIDETSMLNKMLTELLTNKKRFASLIKRKEEFGAIDKAVADGIAQKEEEITGLINSLRIKNEERRDTKNYFDIDGFIKNVENLLKKAKSYNKNKSLTDNDGFILVHIRKLLQINKDDILQESILRAVKKI